MSKNIAIPHHIAIIMDGNGRWAKKRFLPKTVGHKSGSDTLKEISGYANEIGVTYLTVYAFSTENWKRSKDEVDGLLNLLEMYLDDFINGNNESDIKVSVIGDITALSDTIRHKIGIVIDATKNRKGLNLIIAINYGGRDEITRGIKKISNDVKNNIISEKDIDSELISRYLDTEGVPDPDLLIRTSGEMRLSNFLLWQIAYTELYFTDVLWPDFSKKDLDLAIEKYNKTERRFGGR